MDAWVRFQSVPMEVLNLVPCAFVLVLLAKEIRGDVVAAVLLAARKRVQSVRN
jgi:hypothetical protein